MSDDDEPTERETDEYWDRYGANEIAILVACKRCDSVVISDVADVDGCVWCVNLA